MTKTEITDLLHNALTYRSRTSYKFYFLKSIFYLCKKKDTLKFADIGLEMIVQSWNDLSNEDYHYTKTDKLKKHKIDLMRNFSICEYENKEKVRKILKDNFNSLIEYISKDVTAYCPYLFISVGQWDKQLKGIQNYHQRHKMIQEYSQNSSCLYEVYDDYLILNSEYFEIINENDSYFFEFVNNELMDYLR